MSNNQSFNAVYKWLNKSQKKAVDSTDGPVMVVAGPGTGKTQVLAARIANILQKTDTNPNSILALTFTESAAVNMRERLVRMIGKTGYYVQISTFHAFCSNVIKTYPEYFPIDRSSEPLTDLERYDLFQSIINDLDLEAIKPLNSPYFYLPDIIKSISDLKREGVSLDDFEEILEEEKKEVAKLEVLFAEAKKAKKRKLPITKTELNKRQKSLAKNLELIKIYREYEKRLRESLRFDFDDMISLVVEAFFKHELLLREYQENIHYFLVDEYQDTNSAQNKVVDQLASFWGESANVFVVGDHNQSIYRFQGASVENMLGFVKRYSKAEVINLDLGYRCPQFIYDASDHVIRENHLKLNETGVVEKLLSSDFGKIKSAKKKNNLDKNQSSIRIYKAPSQTLEIVYVAEEISSLIKDGVDPEEIAILYRHNADQLAIAAALEKWQVRFEIDGGGNILTDPVIEQLLNFFQVISDVRGSLEDEFLYELMQYKWVGLDSLLVMQLGRAAGVAKLSLINLINLGFEEFDKYHIGDDVTSDEFKELKVFVDKLYTWSNLDAQLTFNSWFEQVIKESGYLEWLLEQPSKVELLNSLNSLFREVKALSSQQHHLKLNDFLRAIDTIREHNLQIKIEDLNVNKEAVHLSTVHRAKGREWQYVFMIHVMDGKWGNNRKRDLIKLPQGILKNTNLSEKERNEDERRLFYVGLTRSSKQVIITYPKTWINDNRSKEVVGSLFIEELLDSEEIASKIEMVIADHINKKADDYLVKLLEPVQIHKTKTSEKEFFTHLVKNFKLSVTALNTYLQDPENFKTNVLLRIPRAKPIPMAFGSAIHIALERWHKGSQIIGEKPNKEKILGDFEEALEKELLTKDDFKKRLKYGKKVLDGYFEEYKNDQVNPLFIERFFGSGRRKTILEDIYLTGRIDRIDWIDKSEKTVLVVDYKTGKPKSIGEIEGKTVSSNLSEREQNLPESIRGPYKRQLLFYKLLAEMDKTFPYKVTHATFDFVEPNKQTGKYIRRSFELKDEDVQDLKKLIIEVMEEIRGLRFLDGGLGN